jgi:release factor glutamine methyltransferase
VTVAKLLTGAIERLRRAGMESPRLEARLLLGHAFGVPAIEVYTTKLTLNADVEARFDALLARREGGEPAAYITGHREFWSMDYVVGRGVLIPRPESETLVDAAVRGFDDHNAGLSVLDLGTGSGCLLLAFLRERLKSRGLGVDASAGALRYARANAERLGHADRARFEERDWANGVDGTFDVIFANPPYLTDRDLAEAPAEVKAEPKAALAGGPDGLDAFRAISSQLARLLKPEGRAFVEVGRGQAGAASTIFSSESLETESVVPDLSGIPRCLVLAARAV